MKLLDSDIIIYASKPGFEFVHPLQVDCRAQFSRPLRGISISLISKIRSLAKAREGPSASPYHRATLGHVPSWVARTRRLFAWRNVNLVTFKKASYFSPARDGGLA